MSLDFSHMKLNDLLTLRHDPSKKVCYVEMTLVGRKELTPL